MKKSIQRIIRAVGLMPLIGVYLSVASQSKLTPIPANQ